MTRTVSEVIELFGQNLYPVHRVDWSDPNHEEYIPYDIIAPHENQAWNNNGQSLARLAERGGLGWAEILAIIEDKKWKEIELEGYTTDVEKAKTAVMEHVSHYYEKIRKAVQHGNS